MQQTRDALHAIDSGNDEDISTMMSRHFLKTYYRKNVPLVINLPEWQACKWTMHDLVGKIGDRTVQVQHHRTEHDDYELNAPAYAVLMKFNDFALLVQHGTENDTYMVAQNAAFNRSAMEPLWWEVGPLPVMLHNEPSQGFIWLGRDTTTPLHHDLTNNMMCQVMGRKLVRMFPPSDRDRLSPTVGVHSSLGWVDDTTVMQRGLQCKDVWLEPGRALFLPVGWWHCVKSFGVSLTIVYTNFIWSNSFSMGFSQ
jgi:hypothetical protein